MAKITQRLPPEQAVKPPIGLIPKRFYKKNENNNRFQDVCGAITRYYNAGLKINVEWIEEYNELIEVLKIK